MTPHTLSFTFWITDEDEQPLKAELVENLADQLMRAMLERETDIVFDSSVGAALAKAEVDAILTVDTKQEVDAAAVARDSVVESIRAIGGIPIGVFVFPASEPSKTPHQEWHERRAELTNA